MTKQEIRRLARIGAEARLEELQREINAIHRAFPDIRSGQPKQPSVGAADGRTKRPRRRRKMSAAAKKAVSLAQKKRWAEWRAKQANQSAEQNTPVKGVAPTVAARKKK